MEPGRSGRGGRSSDTAKGCIMGLGHDGRGLPFGRKTG